MARGRKRRGRTRVDRQGYKRYSSSGKLVHRHVAERKLGRKLRSGEVVHHKNRDKTDNSRSNLYVFKSQKAHHAIHKKDKKRFGRW